MKYLILLLFLIGCDPIKKVVKEDLDPKLRMNCVYIGEGYQRCENSENICIRDNKYDNSSQCHFKEVIKELWDVVYPEGIAD